MTQTTVRLNAQRRVKVSARRGPSQLDGERCEMTADRLTDDWMTSDNLEERIHPSMILSAVSYFLYLCKVARLTSDAKFITKTDISMDTRVGSAANGHSAFGTADINVPAGQDSVGVKGAGTEATYNLLT